MKSAIFSPYITPGTPSCVLNGNSAFLWEAQNIITSESIEAVKTIFTPDFLRATIIESLELWGKVNITKLYTYPSLVNEKN